MSQNLKTVTAVSALEICRQDPRTLLIDVRSSMEFLFVGHPTGAIHIPWIDEPGKMPMMCRLFLSVEAVIVQKKPVNY